MKISAAMMTSGKFSSLLPNSIQVLSRVCPAFLLATTSAALHCGQSGQPSPDALSRTAAPVDMITVSAMTPASASRRIETGVGASTGLVQAATRDLRSTSTPLMVERCQGGLGGGQPPEIGGFRGRRPVLAAAPAQATITQQMASHCTALRCWPSRASPISAATAGSRLIHTPNSRIGIRRSDSSSSR